MFSDFSLLVLLFSVLPVIVLFFYIKCFYFSFKVLKKNGINGPRPSFFYGNYKERIEMGTVKYLHGLHEEYGNVVGLYLGREPQVLVTDIELMKRILVKDFDCFMDRPSFPGLPEGLFTARGEDWRSLRQILSPTFSSFKMKAMMPIIVKSVDALVEVFGGLADTDKSFDVFKVYGSFTMESIFATAFGRVIEIQKGQSDQLTEVAAKIMSGTLQGKTTSVLYLRMMFRNFPWLEPVFSFMINRSSRQKSAKILYDAAEGIVQERRKEQDTGKHKDLLQLMIDATDEGGKKKLTDAQIVGSSITFMLAGYETTANALSYTSYLLALNPHIQEKLQQEIDRYLEENPDGSLYQAAQDLDYLDMVLQESLRIYPTAPVFARVCAKDYSYNEITIPKGSVVVFLSTILHKDPEFWTDPETFDPLRFTAEEKAKRPQLCYTPFGYGPHSCIGMRFAMLEAKLALMELLRRFSIVRAPDTQVPLETELGITLMPKNGIYLKVVTRDSNSERN